MSAYRSSLSSAAVDSCRHLWLCSNRIKNAERLSIEASYLHLQTQLPTEKSLYFTEAHMKKEICALGSLYGAWILLTLPLAHVTGSPAMLC